VSLFRRREPLHVQLAREGGMTLGDPEPRAPWDAAGIHGLHRVREWDAVTTVDAPGLEGERANFVVLPNGDIVVEEGQGPLEPLADTLERSLQPPFRAEAIRRENDLWAVAGRRIELVELPGIRGEELELTAHGGERTLLVDGERGFGSIPLLERENHVVRAHRVDGELWEVEADPL
jgi:hypothetical protein